VEFQQLNNAWKQNISSFLGASVTKQKFCVVQQPFLYFSWWQPFYFDVAAAFNRVSVQQV